MRLLIDADYLVYSSGFAAQHNHYAVIDKEREHLVLLSDDWPTVKKLVGQDGYKDCWVYKDLEVEPVENALHSCKKQIQAIVSGVEEKFKLASVELYLTGTDNFREQVATIRPYKGNRDPEHKPVHYDALRNYMIEVHDAHVTNGMEADDVVSILQHDVPEVVVAGIDKDLLQVPGIHYVPNSERPWRKVSEQLGLCRQYAQCLAGDATDNIAGCYKVGAKGATKRIKAARDFAIENNYDLELALWQAVVDNYRLSIDEYGAKYNGLSAEEAALENMRLVYMLRSVQEAKDWWKPPQ